MKTIKQTIILTTILLLSILYIVESNNKTYFSKEINNQNNYSSNNSNIVTFDKTIGINAFIDDPLDIMKVAGTVREYHNFSWTLDKINENKFSPSYVKWWSFDDYYKKLYENNITVVPCIQGTSKAIVPNMQKRSQKPILDGSDSLNPLSYKEHASVMFQYAARYGSTTVSDSKLLLANDQERISGLGYIEYYENWNEPDNSWEGEKSHFSGAEMAAMCSADYDGHEGTLGYTYGIKNADKNAKLVMGGVANNGNYINYLYEMKEWTNNNRLDKELPFDVMNFHMYVGKNSPENSNFIERIDSIVNWKNKNAPKKEVWLTEFGWDTNTNSVNGVSYINQRNFLMRTYLIANAHGINRSTMYMIRNSGNESDSGKYSTSGLTSKKDEWNKKTSWYGVYTLKNALTDFSFQKIIKEDDVYIYKFKNLKTKEICYVMWLPTDNGSIINNYNFDIGDYQSAAITTFKEESTVGNTKELKIFDGKIILNISETPVFVKLKDPVIDDDEQVIFEDIQDKNETVIVSTTKVSTTMTTLTTTTTSSKNTTTTSTKQTTKVKDNNKEYVEATTSTTKKVDNQVSKKENSKNYFLRNTVYILLVIVFLLSIVIIKKKL